MKITIFLIVVLVLMLAVLWAYYGGFSRIVITEANCGGEMYVYKDIAGDYRQSGSAMDEVYYKLNNDCKITTFKGVGIYFDNPKTTPVEKLRSQAGCIIESSDTARLSTVQHGFMQSVLPQKKYYVTEFPYKGKLSVLLSLMRVYPSLAEFAGRKGSDKNSAVIEIYDIPQKKIIYRKEIVNIK